MFHWLTQEVSGSPWTYAVVFAACALDVLVPLIPSETIVITAAVVANQGDLMIWLIVVAAALGAIAGDNAVYAIGGRWGERAARRIFRGEKAQARLDWAERAVLRRETAVILVGRFLPGGRTASTFQAGMVGLAWRRFIAADALAATAWAVYTGMLGYLGGSAFSGNTWKPIAGALAIAVVVGLLIEAWRQIQKRRGRDILNDTLPESLG